MGQLRICKWPEVAQLVQGGGGGPGLALSLRPSCPEPVGSGLSKEALGAESGVNVWVPFALAEDAHGGATLFSRTAGPLYGAPI